MPCFSSLRSLGLSSARFVARMDGSGGAGQFEGVDTNSPIQQLTESADPMVA